MQSRLRGNVEFYKTNTKDILSNIQIARMTGFGSIDTNIGKVGNNGVEVFLSGDAINTERFSWVPTLSLSLYGNRLTSYLGEVNDCEGREAAIVSISRFIEARTT